MSLGGNLMIAAGVIMFFALMIVHVALGIAVGIFMIWLGAKMTDSFSRRYAQKRVNKKLRTSVKFCKRFCTDDPEQYKNVAVLNPGFAARYVIGSDGKLKDNIQI